MNINEFLMLALGLIIAYLIGSFSSAVWIGKWFYNTDVREHGSKNAGATNTIRVLGSKPGFLVLVLDAFKGWVSVFFAYLFIPDNWSETSLILVQVGMAIASLLGHVFPLYSGFKGGKGVATLVGIILALCPKELLVCFFIFAVVFAWTRYVSLASIITALSFPLILIFLFQNPHPVLWVFSILLAIFIPLTHRKNIKRLLKGEESKLSFKKKSD